MYLLQVVKLCYVIRLNSDSPKSVMFIHPNFKLFDTDLQQRQILERLSDEQKAQPNSVIEEVHRQRRYCIHDDNRKRIIRRIQETVLNHHS